MTDEQFHLRESRRADGVCPKGCGLMVLRSDIERVCPVCGEWEMATVGYSGGGLTLNKDGVTQYVTQKES